MDVAYYLKQGLNCIRLAKAAEDLEIKADLLALAHDNLELARTCEAPGPELRQPALA